MKNRIFLSFICMAFVLTACNQKNSTKSEQTDANDSIHAVAFINNRVTQIYDTIYANYKKDLGYNDYQQFTSTDYNKLRQEARELTPDETPLDVPGSDYDHWVMGQDYNKDLRMEVLSVSDIEPNTATAVIRVYNFDPQDVTLKLVLENGNWMIDSFVSTFDVNGDTIHFDEKQELKEYVAGLKKK